MIYAIKDMNELVVYHIEIEPSELVYYKIVLHNAKTNIKDSSYKSSLGKYLRKYNININSIVEISENDLFQKHNLEYYTNANKPESTLTLRAEK